jgi:hypothetical protein
MNRNPALDLAARDAAAMVRVASPEDWPNGFVVRNESLPANMLAVAIGAGRGMGEAFRYRGGVAVVLVDVPRLVIDRNNPGAADRAAVEAAACHEAAHAILAPDAPGDHVGGLLEAAGTTVAQYDAADIARHHGPAWAATYWLLVDRGAAFRRWGEILRERVRGELARFGYPPDDVARVTRGADPGVALRRLFRPGGPAATLVATVLPDEHTRVAAIVAAGVARAPQPTGAGA